MCHDELLHHSSSCGLRAMTLLPLRLLLLLACLTAEDTSFPIALPIPLPAWSCIRTTTKTNRKRPEYKSNARGMKTFPTSSSSSSKNNHHKTFCRTRGSPVSERHLFRGTIGNQEHRMPSMLSRIGSLSCDTLR